MLNIVRFKHDAAISWGVVEDGMIHPLLVDGSATFSLLALSLSEIKKKAKEVGRPQIHMADVELLSPITSDAKILCQGANYRQHMIDSGMDPDTKSYNMFFTKSSAAITGPTGSIVKPAHVSLLDYEIEMVLVMAKKTEGPIRVTEENLSDYVAGICIGNDVSARDIQIPQMQFFKGKSYRTFCPLGPVLCLLEPDEMHYLNDLNLILKVNGDVRQSDNTQNLVFKPAETLTEYSQIVDFNPGDVVMTGTPSGCALGLPSPLAVRLSALLPEKKKWELFLKIQRKRSQYLKAGDRLELSIKSKDGRIDLGKQMHTIADIAW